MPYVYYSISFFIYVIKFSNNYQMYLKGFFKQYITNISSTEFEVVLTF